MSSAATTVDEHVGQASGGAKVNTRPGLGRLVGVELRKMTDTRAGFWLLLIAAGASLLAAVITSVSGSDSEHTLRNIVSTTIQPSTLFLAIIGILLVASEWSQRTTLSTFSLTPERGRVILAKALAGIAIGLIATALVYVLGAVCTAIFGGGVDGAWSLPAAVIGQTILYMAVSILIGIAFGAAFLAPAPAIVLFFVLPTAIGLLTALSFLEDAGPWINQQDAYDPMVDAAMSAKQWGHVAVSTAIWLVIPMAIGAWRIRRSEIN